MKTSLRTVFFLVMLFGSYITNTQAAMMWAGVNLSGAEFGSNVPGTYNSDYTYPTNAEVDYFVSKGMNVFRLPFLWERLQRTLNGSFDSTEQGRLTSLVTYMTVTKGVYCLLDPHNYARYGGNVIGASSVTAANFANFWSQLASLFKSNPKVIFGLMNEPNNMDTTTWANDANTAIQAIRATGATNLINVPGNAWTGAWSWVNGNYGTTNAVAMLNIVDPLNNYQFEVHQYLDSDSSGTNSACVSSTIGSTRLADFTSWCRTHGKKGFLGEFAGSSDSTCESAVNDMLSYMETNSDVWTGWTWWSAGPWWGSYMFTLEPSGSTDAPQMATLSPHISRIAGSPSTTAVPAGTTGVPAGTTGSQQGSTTGSQQSGTTGSQQGSGTTGSSVTAGSNSASTTGHVIVVVNEQSNAVKHSSNKAGIAAGAAVGSILGILLIVGIVFLVMKRDAVRNMLDRRTSQHHQPEPNATELGLKKEVSSAALSPQPYTQPYKPAYTPQPTPAVQPYSQPKPTLQPKPVVQPSPAHPNSNSGSRPPPIANRPPTQPRKLQNNPTDLDLVNSQTNLVKKPVPPPKPSKAAMDWKEYYTDDGSKYYYNEKTGESAWELPK